MDHTVQRNKRMLEKVERKGQGCGVAMFQYTVYVTRWCLFIVIEFSSHIAHRTLWTWDLTWDLGLDLGLGT